jgi:hypothetical protein
MLGPSTLVAFVALWSWLIFTLSSQPARSDDTGGVAKHILYNAGHAPLFGIWAAGVAFALATAAQRPIPGVGHACAAIAAAALYGILDEIHQSYIPGRTSSWTDVVTDTGGAIVAMVCLRGVASPRATSAGIVARVVVGLLCILALGAGATWVDELGAHS